MKFCDWRNAVENELIKAGFFPDYAKERVSSIRGLYISETQHPEPKKMAKKLIETCKTGMTYESLFKRYCCRNKIDRSWL